MKGRISQQQRLMQVSSAISKAGLNASTDGKAITIPPSMMCFARNNHELAIILSHELAHAMLGHSQAPQQHAAAGALMGAVLDSLAHHRDSEATIHLSVWGQGWEPLFILPITSARRIMSGFILPPLPDMISA